MVVSLPLRNEMSKMWEGSWVSLGTSTPGPVIRLRECDVRVILLLARFVERSDPSSSAWRKRRGS